MSETNTTRPSVALTILGVICATAPGWLLILAAFGPFGGPRTVSLTFAIPVIAATLLAIWISLTLARHGSRREAIWVGVLALTIGLVAYIAWGYIAALGAQFGDGPL